MYEIYNFKTGDTMGREFSTKKQATDFIKYLQAGTSLKLHWRARKKRTSNAGKSLVGATILSLKRTAKGTIKELKLRLKPSKRKR